MKSGTFDIIRCYALLLLIGLVLVSCGSPGAASGAPVPIGLIAPLSGGSAASGEAIQRGMLLAIDEINAAGGVLGRPLRLVSRDVANDPVAGVAALRDLIDHEQIVAVFGGLFSPVMLAQLDLVHERQIPLVDPWGSVTGITQNGRQPNYAFRVSVSDTYADEFLARYALQIIGAKRPAIIADTSSWGDSNVEGLTQWLHQAGVPIATIQRFDQGETDMRSRVEAMRAAHADAILMIANAPEGGALVRSLSIQDWRVPVISHWGISGGKFVDIAGQRNVEGIYTLQTYSFSGVQSPKARALMERYHTRFRTQTVADITAPVGVAHGYDGMWLLALAIQQAGTTAGPEVRSALESLRTPYDGLVKRYAPPFTAERHDALLADDYLMAIWKNGILVPAPQPRLVP